MASAGAAFTATHGRFFTSNTAASPRTQHPEWMQTFGSKRTTISSFLYSCMGSPTCIDHGMILWMAPEVGGHEGAEWDHRQPFRAGELEPRVGEPVGEPMPACGCRYFGVDERDSSGRKPVDR